MIDSHGSPSLPLILVLIKVILVPVIPPRELIEATTRGSYVTAYDEVVFGFTDSCFATGLRPKAEELDIRSWCPQ
jgi:hypothetical protein